jgi:hypothetical protein
MREACAARLGLEEKRIGTRQRHLGTDEVMNAALDNFLSGRGVQGPVTRGWC